MTGSIDADANTDHMHSLQDLSELDALHRYILSVASGELPRPPATAGDTQQAATQVSACRAPTRWRAGGDMTGRQSGGDVATNGAAESRASTSCAGPTDNEQSPQVVCYACRKERLVSLVSKCCGAIACYSCAVNSTTCHGCRRPIDVTRYEEFDSSRHTVRQPPPNVQRCPFAKTASCAFEYHDDTQLRQHLNDSVQKHLIDTTVTCKEQALVIEQLRSALGRRTCVANAAAQASVQDAVRVAGVVASRTFAGLSSEFEAEKRRLTLPRVIMIVLFLSLFNVLPHMVATIGTILLIRFLASLFIGPVVRTGTSLYKKHARSLGMSCGGRGGRRVGGSGVQTETLVLRRNNMRRFIFGLLKFAIQAWLFVTIYRCVSAIIGY